jgi:hypothetical protein
LRTDEEELLPPTVATEACDLAVALALTEDGQLVELPQSHRAEVLVRLGGHRVGDSDFEMRLR